MANIDERIVQMTFDNKQFESGVSDSMKTLEKLRNALNFDGGAEGLEKLSKEASRLSFDHLANSVDQIANKFTLLGQIGLKTMERIADAAVNAGEKLVKSISVDQVGAGFSKYETKTKAVQTIMAATGKSIEEVNSVLDRLMHYTDETSYDFSTMAATIGKFTSVGVDLEVAEKAMEGIANEAALSGAGIQEANRAMYNFAQAIGSGKVTLIDWKSIENANMGTREFKEELIATAIAMGTLNTENGKTGVIMKETKKATKKTAAEFKKTEVNYKTFASTLSQGWLTSEVLIETLNRYGDTSEGNPLGQKAFEAAKVALTYTDAINSIKDAVSSGWMKSFELIFGNMEEAAELWTNFCNAIIEAVGQISEYRNNLLQIWHDGSEESGGISGYISMIETAKNVWEVFINVLDSAKEAIAAVIPPATGEDLIAITENLRIATEGWKEFFHFDRGVTVEEEVAVMKDLLEDMPHLDGESVLKVGDASNDIKVLNSALKEAGYLGKETRSIFADLNSDLSSGGTGQNVKDLQNALIAAGTTVDGFVADGVYGPKTEAAIKKLQKKLGVEETGIWDYATRTAANKSKQFVKASVPTTQYTKATKTAVSKLQKELGVEVTGVWDEATRRAADNAGLFLKEETRNLIAGLESKDINFGQTGKEVKQLQEALVDAKVAAEDFAVDGVYGQKTEAAVKKLQKELKVAETGVWDEATRKAAKADGRFQKIITKMGEVTHYAGETYKDLEYFEHKVNHAFEIDAFKDGTSSTENIKKLQQALINAGYNLDRYGADGIYGSETQAAVKALQQTLGVEVTGIWDEATRDAAARKGVFTEITTETREVERTVEGSSNAILNFQDIVAGATATLKIFSNIISTVATIGSHVVAVFSPLANSLMGILALIGRIMVHTSDSLDQANVWENAIATADMLLAPLAVIIQNVADAIDGFLERHDDIQSFGDLFAAIGEEIGNAFEGLKNNFPIFGIISDSVESFKKKISGLKQLWGTSWRSSGLFANPLFQKDVNRAPTFIERIRETIDVFFRSVARQSKKYPILSKIGKLYIALFDFSQKFKKIIKNIKNAWNDSPFGKAVKTISTVIGSIWENIDSSAFLAKKKLTFADRIKEMFSGLFDWLKNYKGDNKVIKFISNIIKVFDTVKTFIGNFFENTFGWNKDLPFLDNIVNVFNTIKDKIKEGIANLKKEFDKSALGEIFNVLSMSFKSSKFLKDSGAVKITFFDRIKMAVKALFEYIENYTGDNKVLQFISKAVKLVKKVYKTLKPVVKTVKDIVVGLFDAIKNFSFDSEGNFVLFDNIKKKVEEAKTAVGSFFSSLREKYPIVDKILGAFEWLKEKAGGILGSLSWDSDKSFGENLLINVGTIRTKISEAFSEIKSKWDQFLEEHPKLKMFVDTIMWVINTIKGFIFDDSGKFVLFDNISNGVEKVKETVGGFLSDLSEKYPIVGKIIKTVTLMGNVLKFLFDRLEWDPEKSFAENIQENVKNLADGIELLLENLGKMIVNFSDKHPELAEKLKPLMTVLEAIHGFITTDTSEESTFLGKLKKRFENLQPIFQVIVDSIVNFVKSDEFKTGIAIIGAAVVVALAASLTGIGPILWNALISGITAMSTSGGMIGSIGSALLPIVSAIGVLLSGLLIGTNAFGWDSELPFTENIKNNLETLKNNIIVVIENIKAKIKEFLDEHPEIENFIKTILFVINAIKAAIREFATADTSNAKNPLDALMIRLKAAFGPLIELFNGIKAKVIGFWNSIFNPGDDPDATGTKKKNGLTQVIGGVSKVLNTLFKNLKNNSLETILAKALGFFFGFGIIKILLNLSGGLKKLAQGFASSKTGEKKDSIGTTFLKIAGSILLIAGALLMLAQIPDVWPVLGVLAGALTLIAAFFGALKLLNTGDTVKNIGTGLLHAALSIVVLAVGLWALMSVIKSIVGPTSTNIFTGKKKYANRLPGLLALLLIVAFVAGLAYISNKLAKSGGAIENGGDGINPILQMCVGVIALAYAMGRVTKLIHDYGGWDVMGATVWIVVLLGAIAAIAFVVGKYAPRKTNPFKGMLSACLGIYVLSFALKRVAKTMDKYGGKDFSGGAAWLLGLVILVGAIIFLTSKFGNEDSKGPKGFFSTCLGVYVLAMALSKVAKSMDKYGGKDFSGAAGWLLGFVIVIAGLVMLLGRVTQTVGIQNTAVGVVAMIAVIATVTISIDKITSSMQKLKDVDPEVVKWFLIGLGVVVLATVALAAVLGALGPVAGTIATLGVAAILTAITNFITDAVDIIDKLGIALRRFNSNTSGIDIEQLKTFCAFVKDDLIPMLTALAGTGLKTEDTKDTVSILRSIGAALNTFWDYVKDICDNTDKIKKLEDIPPALTHIIDDMNKIQNPDEGRTRLQKIGSSINLFWTYTKDVTTDNVETIKALAQGAVDVSGIALQIGDSKTIVNKLVSVGSSIKLYSILTEGLAMPSDEDPGAALANQAVQVAGKILEIGDSNSIVHKIVGIGSALKLYSDLMRGIEIPTKDSSLTLESVSDDDVGVLLANSVVSIWESLKEFDEKEMDAIESSIVLLGGALKLYYQVLGEIETTTEDGKDIDIDPETVKGVLETLLAALPDSELFHTAFEQIKTLIPESETGADNVALFSAGVTALAGAIEGYANSIGVLKGKETEIENANSILQTAADIWTNFSEDSTTIPNESQIAVGESFDGGARNISNFAAGVTALGGAIEGYGKALSTLTGKESEIDAANGILEMASTIWTNFSEDNPNLPNEDQIAVGESLNDGSRNLNGFSAGITALGGALEGYIKSISGYKGKEDEIGNANDVIDKLSEIWGKFSDDSDNMPESDMVTSVGDLRKNGDNDISLFASGIQELGGALETYIKNISGIKKGDIELANEVIGTVSTINDALSTTSFTEFCSSILEKTGIIPKREDIYNFSNKIQDLGTGVGQYVAAIKGISIQETDIDLAERLINFVAALPDKLPESGGLTQMIEGTHDLGLFSFEIEQLGEGVAGFAYQLENAKAPDTGETIQFSKYAKSLSDSGTLEALFGVLDSMANFARKLPPMGGVFAFLSGDEAKGFTVFIKKMPELGAAISAFVKGINDSNFSEEIGKLTDDEIDRLIIVIDLMAQLGAIVDSMNTIMPQFLYEDFITTAPKRIVEILNTIGKIDLSDVDWAAIDDVWGTINEHLSGGIDLSSLGSNGGEDSGNSFVAAFATMFSQIETTASDARDDTDFWKGVGEAIVANLKTGLSSSDNSPVTEFDDNIMGRIKAIAKLGITDTTWYRLGYNICSGLKKGIVEYTYLPVNAGVSMMNQLKTAAANAISSNSPSRDFMRLGQYADEGLVIGLQQYSDDVSNASGEVARGALGAAETGISAVQRLLDSDIDGNPTIRPVLDLSEVEDQAGTIGSYFPKQAVGLRVSGSVQKANAISSSDTANAGRGAVDQQLGAAVESLNTKVEELGNKIATMKVVMQSGALVGQIATDMDRALGRRSVLGGRLN